MRQNTTRAGVIGLIGLIAAAIVGCGPRETATSDSGGETGRRERNAELPSTSLVNGSFSLGGGGWTSNGFSLAKGCQSSGGDPSLGGWQKDALAFGYSRQTVQQTVRIMDPGTVTLRIVGAVRSDQAASNFVVSMSGSGQSVTTGPQTGYPLTTPQEFTLSVSTRMPGDLVTISIEGSSASYWGGCYGPIVSNARLDIVSANAFSPTSTVAPSGASTTTAVTSTTSTVLSSTPTSTVPAATTTSSPSTTTSTSSSPSIAPSSTSTPVTTMSSTVSSTSAVAVAGVRSEIRGDGSCTFGPSAVCTDVVNRRTRVSSDLTRWNGSGSDFSDSNFASSTLREADLHMARLDGAIVEKVNLERANLVGSSLGSVSGFRADFDGAKLTNAYLGNANFHQASFSDASLVGSWLDGTDLSEANLQKTDFRGAHMEGIRSGGIVATTALLPVGYKIINGFIVGPGVDLSIPAIGNWAEKRMVDSLAEAPSGYGDAGTTCAELRDRVVRGSKPPHIDDLQGKSLAGLDLTGANLSGLNLTGVDFRGANLTRVNFSGADVSGAKFDGATVVDANFAGAVVSGVNFAVTAEFARIQSGCTIATKLKPVALPKGWVLNQTVVTVRVDRAGYSATGLQAFAVRRGFLLGPSAVLSGAILAGLSLDSIDLRQAILVGVSTASVDGVGIVVPSQRRSDSLLPQGYTWRKNVLLGPDVDLRGADLTDVDFGQSDISFAQLENVSSGNDRGNPLLPIGWKLVNGKLVGPGTRIVNPDFSRIASLDGLDLRGSVLVQPNLDKANLSGVKFGDTQILDGSSKPVLSPKLPPGYVYVNGLVLGPGVDVSYSVLTPDATKDASNPTLSKIDLSTAKLDGTYWRDVKGTPRLPKGWGLDSRGNLFGPSARLSWLDGYLAALSYSRSYSGVVLPPGYVKIHDSVYGPYLRLSSSDGSTIANVDISGSTISGSVFARLNFDNVRGLSLAMQFGGKFANGWSVTDMGTLVGPSADLHEVEMYGDVIPVSDLSRANLNDVHAVNVRFSSPNAVSLPKGWKFLRGLILGPTADLSNANLSGLVLDKVDLSRANLTNARGTNITGRPILPDGWSILRGTLVGPTANLICGSVTSSDLSNDNFTGEYGAYFSPEAFGVDPLRQPLC